MGTEFFLNGFFVVGDLCAPGVGIEGGDFFFEIGENDFFQVAYNGFWGVNSNSVSDDLMLAGCRCLAGFVFVPSASHGQGVGGNPLIEHAAAGLFQHSAVDRNGIFFVRAFWDTRDPVNHTPFHGIDLPDCDSLDRFAQ